MPSKSGDCMQITIVQKNEEPLLSRTMVKATLEFEKATLLRSQLPHWL